MRIIMVRSCHYLSLLNPHNQRYIIYTNQSSTLVGNRRRTTIEKKGYNVLNGHRSHNMVSALLRVKF